MVSALALPTDLYNLVREHLFPGDGLEAAAILLCSRGPEPRTRLLAREAILVPHDACLMRERDALTWPGAVIEDAIDRAEGDDLSIVLIHSHPGGLFAFSLADDASDNTVIPCLFQATGNIHGTALMTPDGAIKARIYRPDMHQQMIDLVTVAGDDIRYWWSDTPDSSSRERPVAFSSGMTAELGKLSACFIGVSGTGSIGAEQAARLGFGKVTPIDFDKTEFRNLNRILNATREDAINGRLKVDVFARSVISHRGQDVVNPIPYSILTREAVIAASQSDVLFCTVDTLEARQIADLMASAFLIPLFDVGVAIPTRKAFDAIAIGDVCGRIDYVMPGGSTLEDRGIYDAASLRAEYLRRTTPKAYGDELNAGYIKGMAEQAPAVISLNMRAAAACVLEFIARAYPYRHDSNRLYARTEFSLAACEEDYKSEDDFKKKQNKMLARGAAEPLLGIPMLSSHKSSKPK